MEHYVENRRTFYEKVPEFWADLYGMEYSLYNIFTIDNETIKLLHNATTAMSHIFFKTAPLLRQLPATMLKQLGFPSDSIPFLKYKSIIPETIIGRFDFVYTSSGELKLLEFNSDTPTFIKECFFVNDLVCKQFGYKSVNTGYEQQLSKVLQKAIKSSAKSIECDNPYVVFTAHDTHEEDWLTTCYLQNLYGLESRCVPLSKLQIRDDGLFDENARKIDVLYRQTYPLEHLIFDQDIQTTDRVGIQLLHTITQKQAAIINPISAFLLQSKAVQALIWGLHEEQHPFFTAQEHDAISKYMLPTYLESDPFANKDAFVQKPAFGREGDTIKVYDKANKPIMENAQTTYLNELPVYQKFVELPRISLQTAKGIEQLSYIFGIFTVAGLSSAMGVRAGNAITGNESYFLPVGLKTT
ncbi:glutathionylspermidine synthase [Bacillus sp. HMF5848]|uniref:glutathionylspermidine synthase family protein n=1 Tax=Bacillus sp. HMF5848 TaxID=2495421 RepID=UPI000F77A014|nr:glutathionylspermidine synthase family protein [Bacillus sp. HMF5848]RSK29321.1 glutathionylspermidine synthase [Bacillus sp. HMF5848]